MDLNKQLVGVAGEYFVAAEMSRRGYLAAVTLRNSDGVDILVSSIEGNRQIAIQVKTTQRSPKWVLTKKVETNYSPNKYYVFVHMPTGSTESPRYWAVDSKVLADHIRGAHQRWLNSPGKNGKVRKDSSVRQFEPKYLQEDEVLTLDQLVQRIESES